MDALRTELVSVLTSMAFALNVLDENNFPNAVSGGKILKADHSTPVAALNWIEIPFPLVLPPQPASTTSSLDCGGFFVWDPIKFPGGKWYLEAAMKQAGGGTAKVQLKLGGAVIGEVSTQATEWTVVRGSALSMPTTSGALTVTLVSSATTVTAYAWTVRLIWQP
ncbi:hypothetical protein [Caldanaerobius polysaccharolyticus]|uniref:hypothetical protein n=1 Tax=Caldanaerobius polysaccharolyticus TaxID=44256 RepID=UPI0012EB46CA|nr:hypothetical protein [Caldanaerobius polysaccharolyticus]